MHFIENELENAIFQNKIIESLGRN